MKIAGVILIIAGVLALAYQGISWTEKETVVDIGPLEAQAEQRKTIPLPPIIGGAMLAGGIVLVIAAGRRGGSRRHAA
jgi:hypothetical protein